MSNEDLIHELRDVLFPPMKVGIATNPIETALSFEGLNLGLPSQKFTYRAFRGGNCKLLLVTVAIMQVEEEPATPKSVREKLNCTFSLNVVRRNLKNMTVPDEMWARTDWRMMDDEVPPLIREKYGRTHRYWVAER